MKLSFAAAAAILIAILSTLSFNGKPMPGMAWADVAKQIRDARTARLHLVVKPHPDSEKDMSDEVFSWKVPDKERIEHLKPKKFTTISNGDREVTLDPELRTYAARRTASPQGGMDQLLALAGVPAPAGKQATGPLAVKIDDAKVELIPQAVQKRDGRELRKYRMKLPETQGQPSNEQDIKYAWFEVKTGKLAMLTAEITVDGRLYEGAVGTIELDVDLSDDLFSLTPPAGYKESAASSMPGRASHPTMSPADRPKAFNDYLAVRDKIDHYRLVVWSATKDGVLPTGRSVRDGSRYRTDRFSLYQGSKQKQYEKETSSATFDRLRPWKDPAALDAVWRLADLDLFLATTIDSGGAPASIRAYLGDVRKASPRVTSKVRGQGIENRFDSPVVRGSDFNAEQYLLASLGWPLHFSGEEILFDGQPLFVYKPLPERPDRAGLVGVRVELNPAGRHHQEGQVYSLYAYWLDPAKDSLCVVHEQYQCVDQPWHGDVNWKPADPVGTQPPEQPRRRDATAWGDQVTRIVEFGRTPAGRWYPLVLQHDSYRVVDGKRYGPLGQEELHIQIDFENPVPADLLKWPKDVPEPKP